VAVFCFSSRRRHTRCYRDWSSDVCSSDLFGLAMIEAMACGTPVIAYPFGSVPEVLDEGQTGFIVRDEGEAVQALEKVESLDRMRSEERRVGKGCRASERPELSE